MHTDCFRMVVHCNYRGAGSAGYLCRIHSKVVGIVAGEKHRGRHFEVVGLYGKLVYLCFFANCCGIVGEIKEFFRCDLHACRSGLYIGGRPQSECELGY